MNTTHRAQRRAYQTPSGHAVGQRTTHVLAPRRRNPDHMLSDHALEKIIPHVFGPCGWQRHASRLRANHPGQPTTRLRATCSGRLASRLRGTRQWENTQSTERRRTTLFTKRGVRRRARPLGKHAARCRATRKGTLTRHPPSSHPLGATYHTPSGQALHRCSPLLVTRQRVCAHMPSGLALG